MLRRLRIWFIRLLTGQGEHERHVRLLESLTAFGVSRYKNGDLDIELRAPERPASKERALNPGGMTDNEILFGESEDQLRKQGIV